MLILNKAYTLSDDAMEDILSSVKRNVSREASLPIKEATDNLNAGVAMAIKEHLDCIDES